MSTNDILRKYLDMLNEAGETTVPVTAAPSEHITYAPPQGKGSIKKVIEAVKEFQEEVGILADGRITPPTLAAILSQSGTMGQEELAKLQKAPEQDAEVVAEAAEGRGKHDMLADKASLHLGYAHGLMGEEHQCSHPVGSSSHSHYAHGHQEGLKECGVMRTGQVAPPTAGF